MQPLFGQLGWAPPSFSAQNLSVILVKPLENQICICGSDQSDCLQKSPVVRVQAQARHLEEEQNLHLSLQDMKLWQINLEMSIPLDFNGRVEAREGVLFSDNLKVIDEHTNATVSGLYQPNGSQYMSNSQRRFWRICIQIFEDLTKKVFTHVFRIWYKRCSWEKRDLCVSDSNRSCSEFFMYVAICVSTSSHRTSNKRLHQYFPVGMVVHIWAVKDKGNCM